MLFEIALNFVFLAVGILLGMNFKNERLERHYKQTVDQVDRKIRKDLEYYQNLSESLKHDLLWEKQKTSRKNDRS